MMTPYGTAFAFIIKATKFYYGSAPDDISNLLNVALLIPGIDTFTNLTSIPVDLATVNRL